MSKKKFVKEKRVKMKTGGRGKGVRREIVVAAYFLRDDDDFL